MTKKKMSIENMKGVLDNILSREEMREIQAGSGGYFQCGNCSFIGVDPSTGKPVAVHYACWREYSGPCTCGGGYGGQAC